MEFNIKVSEGKLDCGAICDLDGNLNILVVVVVIGVVGGLDGATVVCVDTITISAGAEGSI